LQESNLQLVHGDVLQLNLQELIDRVTHAAEAAQEQQQQQDAGVPSSTSRSTDLQQPLQHKRRKVKVVANLPYNITKDFLVALFPKGDLIAELSIMIQVS
jgi:16S rRNA A1518/A1519 N6-dimethyltransferase RsmA/KsgA/DIM1 with predicted DNA glycosylase/AP lyase activity